MFRYVYLLFCPGSINRKNELFHYLIFIQIRTFVKQIFFFLSFVIYLFFKQQKTPNISVIYINIYIGTIFVQENVTDVGDSDTRCVCVKSFNCTVLCTEMIQCVYKMCIQVYFFILCLEQNKKGNFCRGLTIKYTQMILRLFSFYFFGLVLTQN